MRTCIEGCGNILTPADDKRFPESLSRPLPDVQQNDILILNMRLRCANCYNKRYNKKYYAISYRWSHANRNHSFATVTVYDESTGTIRPGVRIPVRSQKQRSVIMSCKLFFLDVLNAPSKSGQWYTSNLWRTYTSCKGLKILLGASDHDLLYGKREKPLHQSGMTRDRDGYLRAKYGKEERASAYMRMSPDDVRFYSIYGSDMGNIEMQGLVPREHNVYQEMLETRSHELYGSGSMRPGGASIAKMFSTHGVNGHFAVRTPTNVIPGLMPANLDPGFAEPLPFDTTPSAVGTSLNLPSLNSSLSLTGIGGSTLGYDIEAPPIPSSYHTSLILTGVGGSTFGYGYEASSIPSSLDLTGVDGSAELLAAGMDLSSVTTYMFSNGTGVGDAFLASLTDDMSGMHISSEFGQLYDPHSK